MTYRDAWDRFDRTLHAEEPPIRVRSVRCEGPSGPQQMAALGVVEHQPATLGHRVAGEPQVAGRKNYPRFRSTRVRDWALCQRRSPAPGRTPGPNRGLPRPQREPAPTSAIFRLSTEPGWSVLTLGPYPHPISLQEDMQPTFGIENRAAGGLESHPRKDAEVVDTFVARRYHSVHNVMNRLPAFSEGRRSECRRTTPGSKRSRRHKQMGA